MASRSFRHAPGVDKHERGAMLVYQLGKPVIHFTPHFARHYRFQGRSWHFNGKVNLSDMADVNDGAFCLVSRVIRARADQKGGDLFYRPLRRRKTYARRRLLDKLLQPFNREREMGASLISDERMDFIYDQSPG